MNQRHMDEKIRLLKMVNLVDGRQICLECKTEDCEHIRRLEEMTNVKEASK